ncbi:hypothetical protein EVAR_102969_1 [Eumeta japonica]|uniref:Uncharacterized protein n=1 Tax=Eumeta variegata TaxID=151549 RepID=A0A4C1UQZ0_EUMVA|nr:hypothetical protein EVAR_102969_1 [Eumeta japonica]
MEKERMTLKFQDDCYIARALAWCPARNNTASDVTCQPSGPGDQRAPIPNDYSLNRRRARVCVCVCAYRGQKPRPVWANSIKFANFTCNHTSVLHLVKHRAHI